jgi:hypothetical protein
MYAPLLSATQYRRMCLSVSICGIFSSNKT